MRRRNKHLSKYEKRLLKLVLCDRLMHGKGYLHKTTRRRLKRWGKCKQYTRKYGRKGKARRDIVHNREFQKCLKKHGIPACIKKVRNTKSTYKGYY